MARNRRRKAGSMRIDAALAAMRPMGFPDTVVRKHVRQLLKVYGDEEEGWYFIEETSYKLLIDTLLDGQTEKECASNLHPSENASTSAEAESKTLVPSDAGSRGADGASASGGSETLLLLPVKQEPDEQIVVKNDVLKADNHKIEENKQVDKPLSLKDGGSVINSVSAKPKRKPCYGWISDGDDDENENENDDDDDFLFFPPANGAKLN